MNTTGVTKITINFPTSGAAPIEIKFTGPITKESIRRDVRRALGLLDDRSLSKDLKLHATAKGEV